MLDDYASAGTTMDNIETPLVSMKERKLSTRSTNKTPRET
jgi:hypothetical protein